MKLKKRKPLPVVAQEDFDNAARALARFLNGVEPGDEFVSVENDHYWVLARIVLEGAGLEVT